MPANRSRTVARLAVTVLLVLLIGGCGGETNDSTSAGQATSTSTTVASTTTTIPPLTAEELAWLKGLSGVRTKVEKAFQAAGSGRLTRAIMVAWGNEMAAWSRQLRRLGAPSDRLQPVYTLVRKVIQTYDKGAKCYARAARVVSADGGYDPSTPAGPIAREGIDCGGAAQGNGANQLYKADAKGDELKAKYG